MKRPIIYRKWYSSLNRWYWCVKSLYACGLKFNRLSPTEKWLRNEALKWVYEQNHKEPQS